MKEYYDQIKSMVDKSVSLLPKKKNPNYTFAAIMTTGSLSQLITTATIYKNTDKLTGKEYDRIVGVINRKINKL